jgi:hypothetical protein
MSETATTTPPPARRCPRCGQTFTDSDCASCLIDLDVLDRDYGGAFDGFTVPSDADPGL